MVVYVALILRMIQVHRNENIQLYTDKWSGCWFGKSKRTKTKQPDFCSVDEDVGSYKIETA